ncbi:MAG: DUF4386 domain-containing protein [Pyrinomonadaceae bacterium]
MSAKTIKFTGASLIFLGVYLNIPFSILGAIFDYPNILRQPTGEVLTRFHAGGTTLIATWYAFALAAVLMVLVVLLVYPVLRSTNENLMRIATAFGVLAGIMQVIGLIRWVFVVPSLANAYTDPAATEATRAATVIVFNTIHQYAGVAIGEHLGQLFTATWAMLVSVSLYKTSRYQSIAGIVIAALMFVGLVEGFATVIKFNPGVFGALTPVAFIALSLWMIVLGIQILRRKPQ